MDRLNTNEPRQGSMQLCECGLLKGWHGEPVPAYYGAERFGEMVSFEFRSRGCLGFKAREDQSYRLTFRRGE